LIEVSLPTLAHPIADGLFEGPTADLHVSLPDLVNISPPSLKRNCDD
jgi:hypothetical protein